MVIYRQNQMGGAASSPNNGTLNNTLPYLLTVTNGNPQSPMNINILAPQNFTTGGSSIPENALNNFPASFNALPNFLTNGAGNANYGAVEYEIVGTNSFIVGGNGTPACINNIQATDKGTTTCNLTTTVAGTVNSPAGGGGFYSYGGGGPADHNLGTGELYLRIRNMYHSACYFVNNCNTPAGPDTPADLSSYFTGNYFIQVNQKPAGVIGKISSWILTPINSQLNSTVATMYNNIVTNIGYINAVRAALVLYLVIHAIHFSLGMIQETQRDFLERFTKISLMLILIGPTSWQFFDTYLYSLFTTGRDEMIGYVTGNANPNALFGFLDKSVGMFFLDSTWVKMASLLAAPILGWVILAIILTCMYWFILVVIEAFLGYIVAMITLASVIILGPIFLTLILFARTKPMFDAWISAMLNFALQPVFLLCTLAVLNEILVVLFYQSLAFSTQPTCILPATSANSFITLMLPVCLIHYPVPAGLGGGVSFNPILIFANAILMLIVVQMIKVFINMMPQVVGLLTGENFQENVFATSGALMDKMNKKVEGLKDLGKAKEGGGGNKGGGSDIKRPGISAPSIPGK